MVFERFWSEKGYVFLSIFFFFSLFPNKNWQIFSSSEMFTQKEAISG